MKRNYDHIPKKQVTELDKQVIALQIEKLRLHRDRAILILNKGITVYFALIILAILGALNGVITTQILNFIVLLGLLVMVLATLPYSMHMKKEEKEIDDLLKKLTE